MRRMLLVCLVVTLFSWTAMAADHPAITPNGALQVTPASIGYPEYTKPSVEKQYTLTLKNSGPISITVPYATVFEDSAKPSAPSGWLGYGPLPGTISPGDSAAVTLILNVGGLVTAGPTTLFGKLRFYYGPSGDSLDLPIHFWVADSIAVPNWDTLTTRCDISLAVGNNGNLGQNAVGNANLNFLPFTQGGVECDTGTNGRGNAAIYLADASPVVVRRTGLGDYSASWSLYGAPPGSPNSFVPLPDEAPMRFVPNWGWDGVRMYASGTFCTADSLIKVERNWFVPSRPADADSCHFILMLTRYYCAIPGLSVSNLAIGDFFDWDIPSDTGDPGYNWNVAGTDPTRRLVYMRGFSSADNAIASQACYPNSRRYAGAALVDMYHRNGGSVIQPWAAYNAANDSFVYPAGGLVPAQVWANMQSTGYSNESRTTDLHSVLVYKNAASNQGYTLQANDTLSIWTAVAVVRPNGGTISQGLDSLKREIDKAFRWYPHVYWYLCSCCVGTTGNVNKSFAETPDLSDLSFLITYFTTTPAPTLPCSAEADLNSSTTIDLSDLSVLIAYLTVTPPPVLEECCRPDY